MTEKTAARIAVIADTSLQRHVLQQALTGSGYQVVMNSDPVRLDQETLSACETDLWLVDLAQSDDSPLIVSERCEVRLKDERADKRMAHWRQVAISACEQCGRSVLPIIHPPISLNDWLGQVTAELKLVLHPVAEPWASHPQPTSLAFLIGPEGGLNESEVALAKTQGFHAARLGPRVLRTETAPVVALSVAQQLWGDF